MCHENTQHGSLSCSRQGCKPFRGTERSYPIRWLYDRTFIPKLNVQFTPRVSRVTSALIQLPVIFQFLCVLITRSRLPLFFSTCIRVFLCFYLRCFLRVRRVLQDENLRHGEVMNRTSVFSEFGNFDPWKELCTRGKKYIVSDWIFRTLDLR